VATFCVFEGQQGQLSPIAETVKTNSAIFPFPDSKKELNNGLFEESPRNIAASISRSPLSAVSHSTTARNAP
jgi:hypothetical protein